jgi:hypothetical protein
MGGEEPVATVLVVRAAIVDLLRTVWDQVGDIDSYADGWDENDPNHIRATGWSNALAEAAEIFQTYQLGLSIAEIDLGDES